MQKLRSYSCLMIDKKEVFLYLYKIKYFEKL